MAASAEVPLPQRVLPLKPEATLIAVSYPAETPEVFAQPYLRTASISTVSVLALTSLMVGQSVQHSAGLPIGLTVAGLHDAYQFRLQPPQPRDPITDFDNSIFCDAVRVAVGSMGRLLQRDQFGDGVQVKAQLPGVGDKRQPVQLGIAVAALPPHPCGRDQAKGPAPHSSGSSSP